MTNPIWSIEAYDEREDPIQAEIAVDLARLQAAIEIVLNDQQVPANMAVTLTLIDTKPMHELNLVHMESDYPTDVLSFPLSTPQEAAAVPDMEFMLGDIVIAPMVAQEQAQAAGHSTAQEMELLTVHGTLHLLGYDHYEEEEKAVMFGLTDTLLARLREAS